MVGRDPRKFRFTVQLVCLFRVDLPDANQPVLNLFATVRVEIELPAGEADARIYRVDCEVEGESRLTDGFEPMNIIFIIRSGRGLSKAEYLIERRLDD